MPLHHGIDWGIYGGLWLMSTGLVFGQKAATPTPVRTVTAVIDFGKDLGQNFGSIFEAADPEGRVRFGAGFLGAYNTVGRSDRFTIHFFVRPAQDDNRFTREPLPKWNSEEMGVYLFDLENRVCALGQTFGGGVRSWNARQNEWQMEPAFAGNSSGDGQMRIGDGIMTFLQNKVEYNGRVILQSSAQDNYRHFYYANGFLFFYHNRQNSMTEIVACPWKPGAQPVDLSQAVALKVEHYGESTWAWGQVGKMVLTVTNRGGVHRFDGRAWKTLREQDGKSYQIYAMLNYYDKLLLGHYPSGCLYEFDGENLKLLENWPPKLAGVSPNDREAQTITIYRGDLYVGVWPWAELWRYNRDLKQWFSMGRMFSRPPVAFPPDHPFENEMRAYNQAHQLENKIAGSRMDNLWGQRLTGLVPADEALFVSTCSKGGAKPKPEFTFLDAEILKEYGQVSRLTMPGNLCAAIRWTGKPVELKFIIASDKMSIVQDGRELASAKLDSSVSANVQTANVRWGLGVFGPFQGALANHSVE